MLYDRQSRTGYNDSPLTGQNQTIPRRVRLITCEISLNQVTFHMTVYYLQKAINGIFSVKEFFIACRNFMLLHNLQSLKINKVLEKICAADGKINLRTTP